MLQTQRGAAMSQARPDPLLTSARSRLQIAALVVVALWSAVLWAALAPDAPPGSEPLARAQPKAMRLLVAAGEPAPGGGAFERFDVAAQPVAAPVNAEGRVAFYASLVAQQCPRGYLPRNWRPHREGGGARRLGAGRRHLSEFASTRCPRSTMRGRSRSAQPSAAVASEGVFLADNGGLKTIALSGMDAPGIISGTFAEFDLPSLNNLDDVVFLATVRRGRETLPVLYLWSNGRLRKLVAAGDLVPGGGTFAQFGVPTITTKGSSPSPPP